MNFIIIAITVLCAIAGFEQASTVESDSYVAAVVEFHSLSIGATAEEQLINRVNEYVTFIHNASAADADIIVFPESALTAVGTPQYVPDASAQVVPCLDSSYADNPIQAISCAARNRTMYVIINLTMKQLNEGEELLYNTNVVFDRTGKVISVYRKFNLFGEVGISKTPTSDMGTFKTDFGVEFGHFICFDIAFGAPANELIKRGITNFAFPTMWFSEIPFLSAVQVQQGWSYANNVNLLAAGSNRAAIGSSGTGIFAGRQGALDALMTDVAQSRLIVSPIKKVPGGNVRPVERAENYITPPIKLKQDYSITNYNFLPLVPGVQHYAVCLNGVCCSIAYIMQDNETVPIDALHYNYFLAYYNGERSYDGVGDGNIRFCAVVACTSDDRSSCGKVFPTDAVVEQRYVFSYLTLSGTFRASSEKQSVTMPSTLTYNLLPLPVHLFSFNDTTTSGDEQLVQITLDETDREHRLLTFGIYSQDFSGGSKIIGTLVMTVLVAVITALRL